MKTSIFPEGAVRMLRVCAVAIILLTTGTPPAAAHFCGPRRVELNVGEAYLWRIVADLIETDSRYSPVLEGPGGVDVTPLRNFMARHGDFIIVGKVPGTNTLSVAWSYEPTGGFGLCDVEIVVRTNRTGVTYQSPGNPGFLSARSGALDISAEELRSMLDQFIPAEAKKLLIFTQCFGGNMATSEALANAPNVAIASATSPKQTGKYGGYHDDAARALKPEAGLTAAHVHQIASQGKMTLAPADGGALQDQSVLHGASEWPCTGGGLALAAFPLDPVSTTGPVKSRHIVVFMGQPEVKELYLQNHDGSVTIPSAQGTLRQVEDVADREAIKANFKDQPNTTVSTAGGNPSPDNANAGQNGWDFPGDAEGLKRAIEQAGQAIRNSADPAAEQFILFVGDHGSETFPFIVTPFSLKSGGFSTFKIDLGGADAGSSLSYTLQLNLDNQPSIKLQYAAEPGNKQNPILRPQSLRVAAARDIELELSLPDQPPIRLAQADVSVFDLNQDGIVEPEQGEHITLEFPINERLVLNRLLHDPLEVKVINRSPDTLLVQQLGFSTGRISRPAYVIPPPVIASVRPSGLDKLQLTLEGAPGYAFELKSSTDLVTWTLLNANVTFTLPVMQLEVTRPTGADRIYFRLEKKFPRLP